MYDWAEYYVEFSKRWSGCTSEWFMSHINSIVDNCQASHAFWTISPLDWGILFRSHEYKPSGVWIAWSLPFFCIVVSRKFRISVRKLQMFGESYFNWHFLQDLWKSDKVTANTKFHQTLPNFIPRRNSRKEALVLQGVPRRPGGQEVDLLIEEDCWPGGGPRR